MFDQNLAGVGGAGQSVRTIATVQSAGELASMETPLAYRLRIKSLLVIPVLFIYGDDLLRWIRPADKAAARCEAALGP